MITLHPITCFSPNGQTTYETCPVCQEPDVKVEHGQQTLASDDDGTIKDLRDLGPQHYWHCPRRGDSLVIVLDCPLCAPTQISQEIEHLGRGEGKGLKMEYSRNERAGQLLGFRPPGDAVLAPSELGYRCPVCKNAPMVEHEYDERLTWSEYNSFLWCEVCNRDFPSCLCLEDIEQAIEIFLHSVEEAVWYSYKKSLQPPPITPCQIGPEEVNQMAQCQQQAASRYTWPGKDESFFICSEHARRLRHVAAALGLHLQFIPLSEDEQAQASCSLPS